MSRVGAGAILFFAILAAAAGGAQAANQTVANCSNDAELRADLTAMQQSGGGTLTFSCQTSTILLTSVLPDITTNTKIDGGGKITLSGGNSLRLFVVQASGTLELEDIVLTNGSSNGDGGAIFSFGVVTLRRTEVRNSAAGLSGGAVIAYGPLTIEDSVFSGNRAVNAGAIFARFEPAVVSIHDSVFHHNETTDKTMGFGGAILLWDGAAVTMDGTHFHDNHGAQGGAVHNPFANSSVTISTSLFERNIAGFEGFEFDFHQGGAIYSHGTLNVETTVFLDNGARRHGGGLLIAGAGSTSMEDSVIRGGSAIAGAGIYATDDSQVTIRRSTIYDNEAAEGAAVHLSVDAVVNLENATVAANDGGFGSAFYVFEGQLTLSNSTVHMNSSTEGGVVYAGSELASVLLRNTILSANSGSNCAFDEERIVSLDGNLSDDDSCSAALTGLHDVNGPAYDPLLELSETSDPFQVVYVPQPGSPAIDAAISNGAPSHDQRGVSRPQGDSHDRGAIEVRACPDDVVCGDATGDGAIVTADALIALRTAVGTASCPLWRCDFTGDGAMTASDALAILRKAVGQSPDAQCPEAWDCGDD